MAEFERPRWMADHETDACLACQRPFTLFFRRHHCRLCGRIYCDGCTTVSVAVPPVLGYVEPVRCCNACRQSLAVGVDTRLSFPVAAVSRASHDFGERRVQQQAAEQQQQQQQQQQHHTANEGATYTLSASDESRLSVLEQRTRTPSDVPNYLRETADFLSPPPPSVIFETVDVHTKSSRRLEMGEWGIRVTEAFEPFAERWTFPFADIKSCTNLDAESVSFVWRKSRTSSLFKTSYSSPQAFEIRKSFERFVHHALSKISQYSRIPSAPHSSTTASSNSSSEKDGQEAEVATNNSNSN